MKPARIDLGTALTVELSPDPWDEIQRSTITGAGASVEAWAHQVVESEGASTATVGPAEIDLREIRREFTLRRVRLWESLRTRAILFVLGLLGLFVVSVAIAGALWVSIPSLVPGWTSVAISSDSMAPAIRRGDVVIAAPSDGLDLSPGAVVVFEDPAGSGLVTHRIVGLNPDGTYRTQGDANAKPDSTPLRLEQVVGAGRFLVPLVGLPLAWLSAGERAHLIVWAVSMLVSLWLARFALLDRYNPWSPSRFEDAETG